LRDKLTFARKQWLGFLGRNSYLVTELPTGLLSYTNEQALEVYLYGDRVHLNPALRARYESWSSNAGCRAIIETQLCTILDCLHVGISVLRDFHVDVLAQSNN
jgi:hypothetical protein